MRRHSFGGMVRNAVANYIGEGFAVFPLSENSKVPLKGTHGYKDATKSIEEFENLWNLQSITNIEIADGEDK